MGKLSVLVDGVSVWLRTGDQGNVWKSGKIDLPTKGTPTITFVGERGSSYRGDAAIDAIKFVPVGGGSTWSSRTTRTTRAGHHSCRTSRAARSSTVNKAHSSSGQRRSKCNDGLVVSSRT